MKNYNEINQGIIEFNIQSDISAAQSQREFDIESQIDNMWQDIITEEDHKEFTIAAAQMRANI